tara:strand:- start:5863 stop:6183 length:321 start_codon:yes stop_codon:yes gene_type:complete
MSKYATKLGRAIYTNSSPYTTSSPVLAGQGSNIQILIWGYSTNAASASVITENSTNEPLVYVPAGSALMFENPIAVGAGNGIDVSADDIIVYYSLEPVAATYGGKV